MDEERFSSPVVCELLRELIRIPSVNPSLAPDEPHGEEKIAGFCRDWLAGHGIESWVEEAAPGRTNAVARLEGAESPTLIFCGHLDTVGTAGMTIDPFEPRMDGSRIYGRGSYDMKGGVAAILLAAAALAREPPSGRILLALVADEEYASRGAEDFVRRYGGDACIVTEPSDLRLILGHKGFVWLDVTTRGRAAHGSRWDLGVSAIGKMGRIVAALEEFDGDELRGRHHPLVGPASLHCALIQGGSGLSTYAESCRLQVERRTLPGETPDQVLDEIRSVIRRAAEEAEVEMGLYRNPLLCDRQTKVVESLRGAARDLTGHDPEESGVGYWMDAALFAETGIPTVNYGPSGAGEHEAVEWVDAESVATCARVLAEAARRFCNPDG